MRVVCVFTWVEAGHLLLHVRDYDIGERNGGSEFQNEGRDAAAELAPVSNWMDTAHVRLAHDSVLFFPVRELRRPPRFRVGQYMHATALKKKGWLMYIQANNTLFPCNNNDARKSCFGHLFCTKQMLFAILQGKTFERKNNVLYIYTL